VNAFRTGKQYKDEDAAKEVNGGASAKMNLKESTGMALVGIIGAVIRMNWKGADVEEFRDLLRQAAVSFLATVSVLVLCSYYPMLLSLSLVVSCLVCCSDHIFVW
jgi:hypothetical protein